MGASRLAVLAAACGLVLGVAGCASGDPDAEPGGTGTTPTEDFYTIDGSSFRLSGSCGVSDGVLVADFEGLPSSDGGDYAQLRFSGELGEAPMDRATFSTTSAQGLIADSWDRTTAAFRDDFRIVVGDGLLSGSGQYLAPDGSGTLDIAFQVGCDTSGVLAADGTGDEAAPPAAPESTTFPVACLLLTGEDIASIAPIETGHWVLDADDGTSCTYIDDLGDRVTVELRSYAAFDAIEETDMWLGYKFIGDADGYLQGWGQAGGPRIGDEFAMATVGIIQAPLFLDDAQLGSLLQTAQLAHENLPASAFGD